MNKRIKELADQVMKDAKGSLNFEQFYEKFAELIVKECINCIESTDKGYIFTAKDAGIVNAAHTRSMEKVKKHFGVEE